MESSRQQSRRHEFMAALNNKSHHEGFDAIALLHGEIEKLRKVQPAME
jgi:hypothetical protein